MCGDYKEPNEPMIEMPKVRSLSAVAKDGVLQITNTGYSLLLELVDTQTKYTKKQQEASLFDVIDGFTKEGFPIVLTQEIETLEIGAVLLAQLGVKKPRSGSSVRIS